MMITPRLELRPLQSGDKKQAKTLVKAEHEGRRENGLGELGGIAAVERYRPCMRSRALHWHARMKWGWVVAFFPHDLAHDAKHARVLVEPQTRLRERKRVPVFVVTVGERGGGGRM